jgi:predicted nucleic acid-binding Zn ribbon protein
MDPAVPKATTLCCELLNAPAADHCEAARTARNATPCVTASSTHRHAARKKHPEFTAKQVIEQLGPGPFMNIKWVRQIMKDCWRATVRHGTRPGTTDGAGITIGGLVIRVPV